METSESSWRLDFQENGVLDLALFLRDALRLPVAASPDAPGPIPGDVPDHSALLSPAEAAAAASAWPR